MSRYASRQLCHPAWAAMHCPALHVASWLLRLEVWGALGLHKCTCSRSAVLPQLHVAWQAVGKHQAAHAAAQLAPTNSSSFPVFCTAFFAAPVAQWLCCAGPGHRPFHHPAPPVLCWLSHGGCSPGDSEGILRRRPSTVSTVTLIPFGLVSTATSQLVNCCRPVIPVARAVMNQTRGLKYVTACLSLSTHSPLSLL